jgi:endonuclease/exonuclease/phosphatase family metal-dependent hydrolase
MKSFLCLVLWAAAWPAAAEPLRVMSFNVRYPSPNDGPNVWEARRDLLVAVIRSRAPDLIGTQELFHEQGQYIVAKLPEYAWFGRSRRGNQEDEHMGVFYRKERLALVESGDFWLSETPETPGSMSWNVSLPRMVTWERFEDRRSGERFHFFNTHFPHRPQDAEARLRCTEVILSRLKQLPKDAPVIITGDFNAPAGGEVYRLLVAELTDAWAAAAERAGPEGTFHGFRGQPTGPRIDWILFRGPWRAVRAETVTDHQEERYPSDHFPVLAVLE